MNTVSFPGLGIGAFHLNSDAFSIGPITVKWYAICICLGLIIAFLVCERKAKFFGIKDDDFLDLVLFAVPIGLIGARVGYILMDLKSFSSFSDMIAVWNGGLSIYGGLIAAFLALIVLCKIKKVDLFSVLDLAVIGIMIGQILGRFGNFFNIEVYGQQTNLPWRMGIGVDGISEYVHPLFLYEAIWNLIGLVLILAFLDQRKFKGEAFLWYSAWYGLGRGFMEGLRDSEFQLMLGSIRINQLIAFVALGAAVIAWVYFRFFKISVHIDIGDEEKSMTFRQLRTLHKQEKMQQERKRYSKQFSEQLSEEAGISEDEYLIGKIFDQADQKTKDSEDEVKDHGQDH